MRKLCIWDFQRFQIVRNCTWFSTFWLLPNFYSGDAHHANYAKNCLHHHFQHCANCLYEIFSVFKLFEIGVFFCTFWLLRNFYSGDARHANYAKHSSNHHFRYCANCVYQIYSVFQLFEIAVCFAHFGCYEISTPVMRTMLTMPNVVYIIISNIPPTVYIRYTTFWNSSKLLFVLHILAFTKFQLRWYAPFQLLWTLFKSSFLPLRSLWKSDLNCYKTFRSCSLFWHILDYMKFLLQWCAPCKPWWTLFKSSFLILCKLGKSDLQPFEPFRNWSLFLHVFTFMKFLLRWCAPCELWQTYFKSSFPTFRKLCISDWQRFEPFRNCCSFCTFGFYEISTPVMRTMETTVNVVQIIISDIVQTV